MWGRSEVGWMKREGLWPLGDAIVGGGLDPYNRLEKGDRSCVFCEECAIAALPEKTYSSGKPRVAVRQRQCNTGMSEAAERMLLVRLRGIVGRVEVARI